MSAIRAISSADNPQNSAANSSAFAKIINTIYKIAAAIFHFLTFYYFFQRPNDQNSSLNTRVSQSSQSISSSLQNSNIATPSENSCIESPHVKNIKRVYENGNGTLGCIGISQLRNYEQNQKYSDIRDHHFDWWLFPIDRDSSQGDIYTLAKADFELLSQDSTFMRNYHDSIRIVLSAWGWNLENKTVASNGQHWNGYGIRLAKMANSVLLFKENCKDAKQKAKLSMIFESMQLFYQRIVLPANISTRNCSSFNLVQQYLG